MISRRHFIKQGLLWLASGPLIAKAQDVVPTRRLPFTGSVCTASVAWANQIVSNGGIRPTNSVLQAACTYNSSLVTAAVDSLIIADVLYPPNTGIAGTTTPFRKTLGNSPWTNHNFVVGDLTASGLTGDGSTKFLDTGIVDNVAWASGTELGIAYYYTTVGTGATMALGSLDTNSSNMSRLDANVTGNSASTACFDNGSVASTYPFAIFPAAHAGGFLAAVRQSSSRADLYAGNSVVAFSSLANVTTQGAGRPLGQNLFCHAINNSGGGAMNFSAQTYQYACVFRGLGMTLVKITALFNAVQALQVALGRAQ